MKKSKKLQPYHVPESILKLVVILVLAIFALIDGQSIYYMATLNAPQGASDLYYMSFISDFSPLVVFAIAYTMNPRKLSVWGHLFESLLLSLLGVALVTLASSIGGFFPSWTQSNASYGIAMGISYGVGVLAFAGLLYWLRRSKRWA